MWPAGGGGVSRGVRGVDVAHDFSTTILCLERKTATTMSMCSGVSRLRLTCLLAKYITELRRRDCRGECKPSVSFNYSRETLVLCRSLTASCFCCGIFLCRCTRRRSRTQRGQLLDMYRIRLANSVVNKFNHSPSHRMPPCTSPIPLPSKSHRQPSAKTPSSPIVKS